ncbi:exonuclease domain-containing protein [Vibrio crassostreae]|uniref:exonuclease domain-containing protein n=1 Tax=Vibrio crassostreae TaxID=246167 RepID=UPI001B315E96
MCYDLEMCCWKEHKEVGEIIEIGAVIVDLKTKKIGKKQSIIVKPDGDKVSEFCTELTGITQRMVDRQGVKLNEAIRRLTKNISMKNNPWFAWGRDIDTLVREFGEKRLPITPSNFHDASIFFKMSHGANRNLGMVEVCSMYDVETIEPAHRALPDAETLAKLMLKSFG